MGKKVNIYFGILHLNIAVLKYFIKSMGTDVSLYFDTRWDKLVLLDTYNNIYIAHQTN